MPGPFYPKTGQVWLAGLVQTAGVNAVVKLYQQGLVTPTQDTTDTELDAAEADYSGYAAITVAAWNDPFLTALGAAINFPSIEFRPNAATVSNVIGGAWIEDAAGVVVVIIPFPKPVSMDGVLSAIPLSQLLRYGSGQ